MTPRTPGPLWTGRLAGWAVWGLWAGMVAVAVAAIVEIGRDVPLAEDWLLVWPLAGEEPDLAAWLWAQNNEHRVPLPRGLLLVALSLFGDDFRAGMVLNVAVLAALSGAMVLTVRRLRGGTARFSDAFFPLLLLHLGHWPNLFWSWQLTQVLPTALACASLLAVVAAPSPSRRAATVVGACVVLLPLCGANGILYVPALASWLWWATTRHGEGARLGEGVPRGAARGAVAVAVALCVLYFVGYERPAWVPPNPGLGASAVAAVQFATLGLGPAVREAWVPAATVALGAFGVSLWAVVTAARHRGDAERTRAVGLLLFLLNAAAYALAVGWGRAGAIAESGEWPLRYALMGAPAYAAAYVAWVLYGPGRLRGAAQAALCVIVAVATPLNTSAGLYWGRWYHSGMLALERDVATGMPADSLSRRHGEFLVHWWEEERLAQGVRLLQEMGVGPFGTSHDPSGPPSGRPDRRP